MFLAQITAKALPHTAGAWFRESAKPIPLKTAVTLLETPESSWLREHDDPQVCPPAIQKLGTGI